MSDRLAILPAFERFLTRRSPDRTTAINYVSDVRQFAACCPKPWAEVTIQDVDAFVDYQRQIGRQSRTIRRHVAGLKVFFDFLADEAGHGVHENPVQFKRHAGQAAHRLPRDLTDEQVERLQQVISLPRDRAWFALLLRAGVRVGELVDLSLDDLLSPPDDVQPARLRVEGKGRQERVVLLSSDAYAVLAEWLAVRPVSKYRALFLNERGQPLTANGVEWLLHRYGEQCGVAVTPHQLRHTFARQMTEHGLPLPSLSKLLGHAQLETTQVYTAGADPQLAALYAHRD